MVNYMLGSDDMMLFRKAILLVHGFAGGSYDYGELGNILEYRYNFDVYTFTLPGHDKTIISKVTKDDWIKSAEDMIEKLINHGYRSIYVVGHSMGGVIASHLAFKYKEVKKLVLAAPAFKYMKFKNDKFNLLETIKDRKEIFNNYSIDMIISRIFKVPVKSAIEFMKLVDSYKDEVKSITCPVLIIHGSEDYIVPEDSAIYVHNSVKSRVNVLINVDGADHNCFRGNRGDDVIKVIYDFLARKQFKGIKEKSI